MELRLRASIESLDLPSRTGRIIGQFDLQGEGGFFDREG
jgi:hypothetical protein